MPTITDITGAGAQSASVISCDLPVNTSTNRLVVCVAAYFTTGGAAPTFTLSGWTSITTVTHDPIAPLNTRGLYAQMFHRAGGLTGQITVTFSKTALDLSIAILTLADAGTTLNGSNTSTTTDSFTQSITGITTTLANDLLIGFWNIDEAATLISNQLSQVTGSAGSVLTSLVAAGVQAVAGASGAKTASVYGQDGGPGDASGAHILAAFPPYEGPTIPVLTSPNGGESLTAGATFTITWSPSSSPTAAQSSLQYNLDYSANNGVTWTSIVALTTAGVTSYAWTVPSTTGTGYLVRIRGYDPAITTYSLGYDQSNAQFSVVAEVTPGQPVITAPAVGSAQNKAVNVTVSWIHQGGIGNPQTEFTLQWATNSSFSGATTVGPTTTATQSTSIDFSAQASGTTIYVRVKTKGLSLESAYSNTVAFIVASLPATPNITAPVAASPPTIPQPTITFTSADAFVARKMRVTIAGIEAYNSGTVISTATSFTSPYFFANNVQVILYLSIQSVYGLWSAEDSETLTPSYAGPATPTITVTANDDDGYVSIQITNTDTPSYNEVWRRQLGQSAADATQISPSSVGVDGTFLDYSARSGITYVYFARAVNSGTTLFTDSADAQTSITLGQLVLTIPAILSTANASAAASVVNHGAGPLVKRQAGTAVKLLGRSRPVPILGETVGGAISYTVVVLTSQTGLYATVMTMLESGELICVRDQFGNRMFGKVGSIQVSDSSAYWLISFTLTEEHHEESATGVDVVPATVSGFIPTDISSCIMWLEAENITGVAHGGAVSSWPDASGSNNHAVQSDGAKQPILYLDRINGLPSVKFDGTADTLTTAAALWSGTAARAMFVVYKPASSGTNRIICGQSTVSTSGTTFELGYSSVTSFNPRFLTPLSTIVTAAGVDDTLWQIVGITYSGTLSNMYWNGITAIPSSLALNTTSAVFRLGSRLNTGVEERFWDGEIAAVACFSAVPTLDQLRALTSTWSGKYGLF